MVRQKADDAVHGVEVGAVEQVSPVTPGIDEARGTQCLQMKRECRRRNSESSGNLTRRIALRTALHQQPKQRKAGFLGQGGEGGNGYI